MANKLLFCFLCLNLRLDEAQASVTNVKGGSTGKVLRTPGSEYFCTHFIICFYLDRLQKGAYLYQRSAMRRGTTDVWEGAAAPNFPPGLDLPQVQYLRIPIWIDACAYLI